MTERVASSPAFACKASYIVQVGSVVSAWTVATQRYWLAARLAQFIPVTQVAACHAASVPVRGTAVDPAHLVTCVTSPRGR
jgi:hypothetical protein